MNLKPRVRRLERTYVSNPDAWLETISTEELVFLLHREMQAILADAAIAPEYRASVVFELAALPPAPSIDEHRSTALISHWTGT
jgi:hypothetical protein